MCKLPPVGKDQFLLILTSSASHAGHVFNHMAGVVSSDIFSGKKIKIDLAHRG